MLAVVLLSAVLAQSAGPDPVVIVKAIDDWRLRVLVRPLDERPVKAVALEPRAKKTKSARQEPHTRITLPRAEGVCFTFSPVPDEPFDVIVTLGADPVHRIAKKGLRDANSPPPPPPPYRVSSGVLQEPTCF